MYCEPEEKKKFKLFQVQVIFYIPFWQEILEKSKFELKILAIHHSCKTYRFI